MVVGREEEKMGDRERRGEWEGKEAERVRKGKQKDTVRERKG